MKNLNQINVKNIKNRLNVKRTVTKLHSSKKDNTTTSIVETLPTWTFFA